MGPQSARSYPGRRPVKPAPPKAQRARQEIDYGRRGKGYVFGAFRPATGQAFTATYTGRTTANWVDFLGAVEGWIEAGIERVYAVVDNLNIHSAASFYGVFDAERARRLSRRIEFRYTPVHGSWLNMAEIEISVLVRQCLGKRRVPDAKTLGGEARAWCEERNRLGASVDWRFSTKEARTKLRRLYPSIER